MKKRLFALLCAALLLCLVCAGCAGGKSDAGSEKDAAPSAEAAEPALADGVYSAKFDTDSSMFHVNEACEGRGTLTVENGQMTIHIVMPSKNVLNLFCGTAEDAQKDGAALLEPTVETVDYGDGTSDEVYAFDVPVPYLDEEFDCALVGTKGKWYDHKVSVSDPVPAGEAEAAVAIPDGEYTIEVTLSGGSGRASVESPAKLTIENGACIAEIVWSSSHYEYMTVGEVRYDPVNTEGNSTFRIPVVLDMDMVVSALTTAMSEPHLIDYTLHFDSSTVR